MEKVEPIKPINEMKFVCPNCDREVIIPLHTQIYECLCGTLTYLRNIPSDNK